MLFSLKQEAPASIGGGTFTMVIVILCSMFIGVELAAWTVETSVRVVAEGVIECSD